MRLRLPVALAMLLTLTVPASAAQTPDPLGRFYAQRLTWTKCLQKLECATFQVPLDYREPAGRSITITAARAKATTGGARGNLVLNPGGPGGSGVTYIQDAGLIVSAAIRREYNLVSFDPRGLTRSTPLQCFDDKQTDAFLEVDPTPDTAAEEQALRDSSNRLITACRLADTGLMQHVSTVEVARDMDILRGLLGDARLHYLGKSWGTALGKAYAALFPKRVGHFVLDGAVDVTLPLTTAGIEQARGFETAANRFINWCIKQGKCVLGSSPTIARTRLIGFFKGLDSRPLKTKNPNRPLTEAQAWTAFIGPLYVTLGGWDWLNIALSDAIAYKDGSELQTINDWFIERDRKGHFTNNANTLIYAVNCLDRYGALSQAQAQQQTGKWAKQLPIMGALMAGGDEACFNWPYSAQEPLHRLTVRDVPPMLVVGSTYDPATPMRWARALQRQIPKSVLLERIGDGHTAYANGSLCIDRIVDAFLLSASVMNPTLPTDGKRCG